MRATARVATTLFPNGQKTLFNYFGNTNDQRLEGIKHVNSSGTVISKFYCTYTAQGQISARTQQADAGPTNVFELGCAILASSQLEQGRKDRREAGKGGKAAGKQEPGHTPERTN